MPGNPLTDPNWAADLADTVERIVTKVRDRATKPVVLLTRGLVYGLLAAFLGIMAIVLLLIVATRGIQALLDLAVSWPRAVYLSYLLLGGILGVGGALMFKSRHTPDA